MAAAPPADYAKEVFVIGAGGTLTKRPEDQATESGTDATHTKFVIGPVTAVRCTSLNRCTHTHTRQGFSLIMLCFSQASYRSQAPAPRGKTGNSPLGCCPSGKLVGGK